MQLSKLLVFLCAMLGSFFYCLGMEIYGNDEAVVLCEEGKAQCSLEEMKVSKEEKISQEIIKNFVPDVYIKEQTQKDIELIEKMRPLFCEYSNKDTSWRKVYERAVQEYGAQEVMLNAEDGFRISALYFKRPHAKLNVVYVTGYFHDATPPKEWCAPFAALFPEYNILAFDWRGIGNSEGENLFLEKNSFGTNAYKDIQAALAFVRKDNNYPIMLHGFCFGGAMALYVTLQAKKEAKQTADALGVSCIFPKFENLFERAFLIEDRWYFRLLLRSGVGEFILDYMMDGSLFDMLPIEFVKDIDLPCYFDHFTDDPFAEFAGGIQVHNNKTKGFKWFVKSDVGRHVRIHGKAPFQYRNAFNEFLSRSGLLPRA